MMKPLLCDHGVLATEVCERCESQAPFDFYHGLIVGSVISMFIYLILGFVVAWVWS